jgi:EAL domain-containing protein (putative c-di-GMP-specific phosphodiesterase class I)
VWKVGAWGTGIFDDDTTCDVRDDFIDFLEEGNSAEEATRIILEEYLDEFTIEDDLEVMSLVYVGLAAIQIEKNCLQETIRKTAIELVNRGADLELWEEADEQDYEERKKVLQELKQKLVNFK